MRAAISSKVLGRLGRIMFDSIASTDLTNVVSRSIGPFVMYRVKIDNIVLTSSSVRSSIFVNNTVPS
ncbi:hypothetical protein A2U01_0100580, partial [Trifolium medium]|nr:hypothetical protein [Trifolium medium]